MVTTEQEIEEDQSQSHHPRVLEAYDQNSYYATEKINMFEIEHGDYIDINDVYISPEIKWTWSYSFPENIYSDNVGINDQII